MTSITEADVESAAMEWLSNLGWETAYGPDITPELPPRSGTTMPRSSWNRA